MNNNECRQTDACLCRECYVRKFGCEPPAPPKDIKPVLVQMRARWGGMVEF
jgi:hypothetical protein